MVALATALRSTNSPRRRKSIADRTAAQILHDNPETLQKAAGAAAIHAAIAR
jgi:hypothetical protein